MIELKCKSEVKLVGVGPDGKPRVQIALNTRTYASSDIIIAAILQAGPSRITHLYGQHTGSGGTSGSLPGDLKLTACSHMIQTSDSADYGGFWIPLLAPPAIGSSDESLYRGNTATFYFRIPGNIPSTQFTGNYVAGTSNIVALGLAVATNANNRSGDILFTVLNSFTPFSIGSSAQEAVDYPLQIIN